MLSLKSPAKINLFLRVIGRRPDGYHELASLFQTIDLHDTISFIEADKDVLRCNDPSLATTEANLVARARQLFKQKTGIERFFSIHLEKQIPMQAGLGGGSSNAATTLWALNQLCGRPASEMELASWGSELGSDVSFFLSTGTAYCTGRGEILQSFPSLEQQNLLIVKPSQGLSTPQVYGKLDFSQLNPQDPKAALASFFLGNPLYFNDLEIPAFQVMPELATLKEKLVGLGFSTVLMSGSGSSFFCLGEGNVSDLSGLQMFPTCYINRKPGHWY